MSTKNRKKARKSPPGAADGEERRRMDKGADGGVVITALQVIEPGILGKVLAIRSNFALWPLVFRSENQGRFVWLQ